MAGLLIVLLAVGAAGVFAGWTVPAVRVEDVIVVVAVDGVEGMERRSHALKRCEREADPAPKPERGMTGLSSICPGDILAAAAAVALSCEASTETRRGTFGLSADVWRAGAVVGLSAGAACTSVAGFVDGRASSDDA